MTKPTPFQRWKGIAKLNEECGEVVQIIGKLMAYPNGQHPDGEGDLKQRLGDELADVQAAIEYFVFRNPIDEIRLNKRRKKKFKQFCKWEMAGIAE